MMDHQTSDADHRAERGQGMHVDEDFWVYPLQWGQTIADQDWFPLYFHRLLGSDFVAEACAAGSAGRAAGFTAFLLWCEAVKQDPGGTLPDNDVALARLAGFGADLAAWREVREAALYGWSPCHVDGDDGRRDRRLGHRTVADFALFAWNRKHGRQMGREAAKLSQVKWKVKKQMEAMKRPARLVGDDMLITQVANWLIRGGMAVSQENVASALAAAGVPSVVPMRRDGSEA
ncbi:DUF1376 domain-containing protein [Defluviimonas sp. SAOS-178_SWC]|uniref:DUF1376 domain-containing protein n=1 Tax=Defluviimonas sp. SAOS-178_SWC TaxID=3121287 RepID=UPI00322167EC